ncbi:MAG: hypothetical protein C4K49_07425, partial [Candidatus Thorarchaeota archaeon]
KDSEMQALRVELQKARGALDTIAREMQGIRVEQAQALSKKRAANGDSVLREELTSAQQAVERIRGDVKRLSSAATAVLNGEAGAMEILREALSEVGDPKYRVLNLVLKRRSVGLDEVASILVSDLSETLKIAEELQLSGEVEIKDGRTIIPALKYRQVKIPLEEWKAATPDSILASLEETVAKAEGKESVAGAIDAAVEILEQKMTRGGAMVFEMRRTASTWRKQEGKIEELRYRIKEWRARANSLG